MNDVTDILEIFLENQKRKHINQGALGALGLVLISMIMNNRQNSENNQLFNISETSPENATSADGLSQGASGPKTECAGTYSVSGYTRADGTEVSAYTRSCGAAHNGNSNSKSEHIEEPDYYAENEGYDIWEGRVEKNEEVEKESQEKSNTENKGYYSHLDEYSNLLRKATQVEYGNVVLPLKDYYKISLDLASNPNKVLSNERYQIYKVDNLPSNYNKQIVYQKIAKGMNVDLSNSGRQTLFKDVRVVVPTENSKLVELIKNSDEIQEILKKEKDNILEGKYKNKYLPNGVVFEMPNGKDILGVIHNADIYDISKTNDRHIQFVITDFYDYDNWEFSEKDSIKKRYIKILNNSAYIQQKTGKLVPYVLYIPIKITQKEFENILKK